LNKITSHKDLKVWQESMDLITEIYSISERFPNHEAYGLIIQLRRAAVSIPSNISEGSGRKGKKEFSRFFLLP
jgi:four helix bundle protein